MNIIKCESLPSISRFKNKEDFVNQIIQEISVICRDNKSFPIMSKIKKLQEYSSELTLKDNKLTELLDKSLKIKTDFQNQCSEIESDNINLKKRLLEFLGSEL